MTTKNLIRKARRVRDINRAQGNLSLSNRIHFLLFLVTKAGDKNPATFDKLEQLLG